MFKRVEVLRGAVPMALVSAVAVLTLGGCMATSEGTAGSGTSAQAGSSDGSAGQPTASGAAAGQSAGNQGGAPAPGCQTSDLKISLGSTLPFGAQGSVAQPLILRNAGSTACTVLGWPGVAALNGGGNQIYQASRVGTEGSKITLQPGASAAAVLYAVTSLGSGGPSCTQVPNFLVIPPNETHSMQVAFDNSVCVAPALTALSPGASGGGSAQSAAEFTEAQQLWRAGASASSAEEGAYWIEASALLTNAVASSAPGSSGFATPAQDLTQLSALPDAMQDATQNAEYHSDISALNSFFGTPGLYS
jgi:Protein of unknown function (DUF4232)